MVKKMIRKNKTLFLIILISSLILAGCAKEPPRPDGAITSAELLAELVYNIPIDVYGQVNGLGEFECPCFALKSGDEQIYVWFNMMVEEDVTGIENGDWIIVSGELKFFENRKVHKDFWLDDYVIIQKHK